MANTTFCELREKEIINATVRGSGAYVTLKLTTVRAQYVQLWFPDRHVSWGFCAIRKNLLSRSAKFKKSAMM